VFVGILMLLEQRRRGRVLLRYPGCRGVHILILLLMVMFLLIFLLLVADLRGIGVMVNQ